MSHYTEMLNRQLLGMIYFVTKMLSVTSIKLKDTSRIRRNAMLFYIPKNLIVPAAAYTSKLYYYKKFQHVMQVSISRDKFVRLFYWSYNKKVKGIKVGLIRIKIYSYNLFSTDMKLCPSP